MSQPAITVHRDSMITDVMTTMERHQIRRVPVVDENEHCVGIVAQADLAWAGPQKDVAVLVREVFRDTDLSSR
jgi:CBS-domain-containing membrane protein